MTEGVDKLITRWRKLSGEKGQRHSLWDDLARVMLPRRMGFTTTVVEGARRTDDIYDGTPMQAARGLANAIGGMMRPSGIPQIQMVSDDDAVNNLGEAKDWLADSTDRFLNAYSNPKARYLQVAPEIDQDLVVFGEAVQFIGESKNRSNLLFQSLHLKDVTPIFSEDGAVEGIFHKRTFTARQLSDRYGEKSLSDATRQTLKDNPDKKVDCLRAVLPRKEYKAGAMLARNLPIADLWIEIEANHQISAGGFHEFPFIYPRWETSSGEGAGSSPGMIALPDSDTLQAMGETILIAGQRAADPPLFAPNDGSFDAVNSFPGGISYYDVETASAMRGNPFFPLESGTNLPVTRDMQLDVRQQVFAAFFRNVLNLPISGPAMTAEEIRARKEEFIREIGPMYGRYDTEKTAPEAERAFMVMLRAGGFAPIPKALQGKNVVFEYDSPVKRIRKQIEAAAARQWAAGMIELGQIKPEALDLINEDELGRFEAEALVVPHKIVNSRETVAKIREARLEAQQQQQEAANMAAAVEVAKTGAEAASKLGFTNEAA